MNTLLCFGLVLCANLALSAAYPAAGEAPVVQLEAAQPAVHTLKALQSADEGLELSESRYGGGGWGHGGGGHGGGYGGHGGGYGGHGGGWGRGGGRGYGGGYGGGWGR